MAPDADDEECDYAALMAAAHDSLVLLSHEGERGGTGPVRRAVVAADAPDRAVHAAGSDEVTAVVVTVPVALDAVHALHVDDAAASGDVGPRRRQRDRRRARETQRSVRVALEDHELLWYATRRDLG